MCINKESFQEGSPPPPPPHTHTTPPTHRPAPAYLYLLAKLLISCHSNYSPQRYSRARLGFYSHCGRSKLSKLSRTATFCCCVWRWSKLRSAKESTSSSRHPIPSHPISLHSIPPYYFRSHPRSFSHPIPPHPSSCPIRSRIFVPGGSRRHLLRDNRRVCRCGQRGG